MNGLRIQVDKDDISTANPGMGSNGYPTADYDMDSVFSGGSVQLKMIKKRNIMPYLEDKIASDLSSMEIIEEAKVTISAGENNGTIYSDGRRGIL